MLYTATKKVPGGKLLRVKIQADEKPDSTINALQISGDFFLHPEDSLPAIEKKLVGLPANTGAQDLAQKIHEALEKEKAAFIGVTAEDIAQTIVEAFQNTRAA